MLLSRRELLCAGLVYPTLYAQRKTQAAAPNILLMVADNLGAWMLGCYGNKDIRTPNIDLLARGGTRFANTFAAAPVSAPSRAALFSGRIQDSPGEVLIPDILAARGYNCGYVGKWDLGNDVTPQHHCSFWHTSQEQLNAKAAEFLAQQRPDKPFFLTVGFFNPGDTPHEPRYDELYANSTFENMGREPAPPSVLERKEMPRDVVSALRRFAAGVSAIDDQVRALLLKLQERGFRENTLVVFCAANGYLLGRHGLWSDGDASNPANMYEEVVEVPLIWNWPGRVAVESVRNEVVSLCDLMPSLCEAAGAEPPTGGVGRSYAALAFGQPPPKKQPWRSLAVAQYRDVRMVRDSRYKLVLRNQSKGPNELFDLNVDPRERLNQFANPAYLSIQDQLRRHIR